MRYISGEIADAASDLDYYYVFLRSAVCHLCPLLKLFDKFRYHLARSRVVPKDTLSQIVSLIPNGRGVWRSNPSQNMLFQIAAKPSVLRWHLHGLVAWRTGNALRPINAVAVRRAGLVLG